MTVGTWGLKHPVPVVILTCAAVFFGLLSFRLLNKEFIPPLMMPTASVLSIWPGVDAQDMEEDVTAVLEKKFSSLPGLNVLRSVSSENVSNITLEFHAEKDPNIMVQEIRARVEDSSEDLPEGLLRIPEVSVWGAGRLPVFSFTVSAPWETDRISRYIEDFIVPEMYAVDGISQVEIFGDRRLELQVRLDPEIMGFFSVDALEVFAAIQRRNLSSPVGVVDWEDGERAFRVTGKFSTKEELANLVVASHANHPVHLSDIAEIAVVYEEAEEYIRSDGENLVLLQLKKRDDGNSVVLSKKIRALLTRLESEGEPGYHFTPLHDDNQIIEPSLKVVFNSALTGILMAIFFIWIFLRNWQATLVVALSLPISLVIVFAGMRLSGQSMNVLTLSGITVALGMVVDASIVVLENIHRLHTSGKDPYSSAAKGVDRVSGAIIASTTTSLSVFAPMIFLSGIVGIILKDLSLTLVLSLSSSLFAALFLVPPLARYSLEKSLVKRTKKAWGQGEGRPKKKRGVGVFVSIENFYRRILERSLGMSGLVLFSSVVLLAISLFFADWIGISFLPVADYEEFFVSLKLPTSSSLEESRLLSDRAENFIRAEIPELTQAVFFVGMQSELEGTARYRDAVWGHVRVISPKQRKRTVMEMIIELNEKLPLILPGVSVAVLNGGFDRLLSISTEGAGFRVELSSESWDDLNAAGDRVQEFLVSRPQFTHVVRDIREDRKVLTAQLDGDALGYLGLSAEKVALASRIIFEGVDAGDFRPEGADTQNIRLTSTLQGAIPNSLSLARFSLKNPQGKMLPFDTVISVQEKIGPAEIRRRNRLRSLTIIAHARTENFRGISRDLEETLHAHPLEGGVRWSIRGVGDLARQSASKLGIVLLIALFLVYAVMAIQFERFIQPLIIMASVPFCFIGVVVGLSIFGSSLSLVSFLGIITLSGIVVNNAIVQVDHINQLRKEGMLLKQAVLKGAVTRLRPILMTTLTTYFAAMPLLLARGIGARIYTSLGQSIAGGLLSSTLVTLFLLPTLYLLVERRKEKKRLRKEWEKGEAEVFGRH